MAAFTTSERIAFSFRSVALSELRLSVLFSSILSLGRLIPLALRGTNIHSVVVPFVFPLQFKKYTQRTREVEVFVGFRLLLYQSPARGLFIVWIVSPLLVALWVGIRIMIFVGDSIFLAVGGVGEIFCSLRLDCWRYLFTGWVGIGNTKIMGGMDGHGYLTLPFLLP